MSQTPKSRHDGWTPERQLRFLDALARTRSVTRAAAAAGISRESAYRLRDRREGALFAALWDRAFALTASAFESHSDTLANGRLMRLLGNHYRRESRDFAAIRRKEERAGQAIGHELCDFKERAPCPSPAAACPDNRACNAGRGFRAG